MPKISVVMPAYNAASTLAEAMNSLAAQTFRDFEVVVVDDGSNDRTAEIALRFSEAFRLRVLVNAQNSGVAASLNRGIADSDSEFIARLDADDLAHPDRLAQQVAFLDASQVIDLCGTHMIMFRHGNPGEQTVHEHPTSDAAIKTMLLQHCALSHPSILMRRSFVTDVGQYDTACDYAEDYDLWCRGALMGKRYANLPVHLTSYRVHPGQVGQSRSKVQCERDLGVKTRYMSALLGGINPGYLPALFSPLVRFETIDAATQALAESTGVLLALGRAAPDPVVYAEILKNCIYRNLK
jgi:glycosyltransferase involved in cell wall biosynthesis